MGDLFAEPAFITREISDIKLYSIKYTPKSQECSEKLRYPVINDQLFGKLTTSHH